MSSREITFAAAGASGPATYVEDVFNTWTYILSNSNATYSITNGIDLLGKGGLVWFKPRSQPVSGDGQNYLFDTVRGSSPTNQRALSTNTTNAQSSFAGDSVLFTSGGFRAVFEDGGTNLFRTTDNLGAPYSQTAWTFREAPKFFDIVTYTGNGVVGRTVTHNLGSVPGMIIVKATSTTSQWNVYHRSIGNTNRLLLNDPGAALSSTNWNNTTPTATEFTLGNNNVNANGQTYVAYLFAHNAGGFGDSGADNIISCGSYSGTGSSGLTVNLGYEPQYLLIKNTSLSTDWLVYDAIRGFFVSGGNGVLYPDLNVPEDVSTAVTVYPTATGFQIDGVSNGYNASGSNFIYMAIRRPMKKPTSGSEVYSPNTFNNTTTTFITTGFPVDLQIASLRSSSSNKAFFDRLRAVNTGGSGSAQSTRRLMSNVTNAQDSGGSSSYANGWSNSGFFVGTTYASQSTITWNFRRATGFFDIVCYTGTGAGLQTFTTNLGVISELTIVKRLDSASTWRVATLAGIGNQLVLNSTAGYADPGANGIGVGTNFLEFYGGADTSASGGIYVAYLFATVPGVSKVGSYTGTGATLNINAGLPTGARFVLIKRTNSTGDWFIWDTARGMVAGTDPRIPLNASTAETNQNWVYTATDGFQIVTTDASVNANGGAYIYLAIA